MKDEKKRSKYPAVNQDTQSSSCSYIDGTTAHHGQTISHRASHVAINQLQPFFPNLKRSQRQGVMIFFFALIQRLKGPELNRSVSYVSW